MEDTMKRISVCLFFAAAILASPAVFAQSSLKGMSLNGATGLYSIPTARIGWERSSNFGLDLGYHALIDEKAAHIPKLSLSLFKLLELSAAIDIQPEQVQGSSGTDFIGSLKFQFPFTGSTAIALGGNFQALNLGNNVKTSTSYWGRYNAGQIYLALTWAGQLFGMPAETSIVLGKTFIQDHSDKNIDFGMGFDVVLLPKVLQRYVHWVTDFANFSYSVEPWSADSRWRGVHNTGLRIDLAAIPALSKFKFALDFFLTDAFDEDRAFALGLVFGVPIL
jgi:hypothetical protein